MVFTFILHYLEKVRNLQISVDKLVGKVLINLLHHTKSAACIISIIIDVPTDAYAHTNTCKTVNKMTVHYLKSRNSYVIKLL